MALTIPDNVSLHLFTSDKNITNMETCASLGLCFVVAVTVTSRYSQGSGTYSISVNCNGLSDFSSCSKSAVSSCSHSNDVGLQCTVGKFTLQFFSFYLMGKCMHKLH